MSFLENTRKPVGLGGKLMVSLMNLGHSPVAWWGLRFLNVAPDAKVLDCGCGGGANIKRLLKKCPQGIVKGIDYSPVSVEKSQKVMRTLSRRDAARFCKAVWRKGSSRRAGLTRSQRLKPSISGRNCRSVSAKSIGC